jgi:hypothetical protein
MYFDHLPLDAFATEEGKDVLRKLFTSRLSKDTTFWNRMKRLN